MHNTLLCALGNPPHSESYHNAKDHMMTKRDGANLVAERLRRRNQVAPEECERRSKQQRFSKALISSVRRHERGHSDDPELQEMLRRNKQYIIYIYV